MRNLARLSLALAAIGIGSVVPGTTATMTLTGVRVTGNRAGTTGRIATVSSSAVNGAKQTVIGTPDDTISSPLPATLRL